MTVIATASNPGSRSAGSTSTGAAPRTPIDTLRDLRAERGDEAELFFITGADALAQILSWQNVNELFALAHFVGVTRPVTG
jgi:nicotinate-nucleotide adenylyltransferase